MCKKKVSYADSLTKLKLVSGLVDIKLKEDTMGAEDKSLENTVKAIEAKQSAKCAKIKLGVTTWRSPGLRLGSASAVGGPVTTSKQREDARSVLPGVRRGQSAREWTTFLTSQPKPQHRDKCFKFRV